MPLSAPDPNPAADEGSVGPLPANDIRCPLGAPMAIEARDPRVRDAGRFIAEDGAVIVDAEKAEFPAGPSTAKGRWRESIARKGVGVGLARPVVGLFTSGTHEGACLDAEPIARGKSRGPQNARDSAETLSSRLPFASLLMRSIPHAARSA